MITHVCLMILSSQENQIHATATVITNGMETSACQSTTMQNTTWILINTLTKPSKFQATAMRRVFPVRVLARTNAMPVAKALSMVTIKFQAMVVTTVIAPVLITCT